MSAKIIQPKGVHYLIQDFHHTKEYAQEYIDMLIEKSLDYIARKKRGVFCAPLKTVEQLEHELTNIRKFEIIEFSRWPK